MSNTTHVQTIVSGDISRYYYRDCSCGWQGPPRHTTGEAMDDSCPVASPPTKGEAPPQEVFDLMAALKKALAGRSAP